MNEESFFDTESEAHDLLLEDQEFEHEADFESGESELTFHPRHGWVNPVCSETAEFETPNSAALTPHPRFGYVQPVQGEDELMEI